ncbi:MAG: RrF2 family transcriptional regulator [Dictyoglomus turgidum]
MFRVSAKLEYGLRAMIFLGKNYPHEKLTLSQISQEENISREFLAQLMSELRRANLVESYKGITGGYTLTKPPHEITLKEIFEALEGPIQIIDCIHIDNKCNKERSCYSKNIWIFIEKKIIDLLGSLTLEDLINGTIRKEEILIL